MFINSAKDFKNLKRGDEISFICKGCQKETIMKYDTSKKYQDRFLSMLCRTCHMKKTRKGTIIAKKEPIAKLELDKVDEFNDNDLVVYECPNCHNLRERRIKTIKENVVCSVCRNKKKMAQRYGSIDRYYDFVRSGKKRKQEKIFVESNEDIDNIGYPRPYRIEFKCSRCGNTSSHVYNKKWRFPLYCPKCIYSLTHDKIKDRENFNKSIIAKYGSLDNFHKIIMEKRKEACMKKYGVSTPLILEENLKKSRQAFKEKYGVDNPSQVEKIKDKIHKQWTPEKRKANGEWFKTDEFKNKSRETCLKKYGVVNGGGSKEAIDKIIQSKIKLYGKGLISRKYKYDNLSFDSSWEVAMYIYCKENGIDIKREPTTIKYMYNGNEYVYVPDFSINGQLVEIKGDHFFNKDGELINPYDRNKDDISKAKWKCMLENNVKVFKKKDCAKYLRYVNEEYGDDFLHNLIV